MQLLKNIKDSLNILLNDDDQGHIAHSIEQLRALGQTLHIAELVDTQTLVRQSAEPIDLILTHMQATHLETMTLLTQLKALKKDIPILVCMETYEAALAIQCIQAGAYAIVTPLTPTLLLSAIQHTHAYAELHRLTQQLRRALNEMHQRYKQAMQSSLNTTATLPHMACPKIESFAPILHTTPTEANQHYLLCLAMDPMSDLIARVGFQEIQLVLNEVMQLIKKVLPNNALMEPFHHDSFLVLLPNTNETATTDLAKILLKQISEHLYETTSQTLQLTLRIGISAQNGQTTDFIDLATKAFRAAHEISLGRPKTNTFLIFKQSEQSTSSSAQKQMEYLKNALNNNQFRMVFQPIIRLKGNEQEIYESFLHIIDDKGNEISREVLFGNAEKANFAEKLDRWLILQAVRALALKRNAGHEPHLLMQISRISLNDSGFVAWLKQTLEQARLMSSRFTFEIDQKEAAQYLKQTTLLTKELTALGCKIAVTQFNGDEAGIQLLSHLHASWVKLESRFAQTLLESERNRKELATLITRLHELKIQVTATGIEGARVLAPLWHAQVDYLQGEYFQAPDEAMNYNFF